MKPLRALSGVVRSSVRSERAPARGLVQRRPGLLVPASRRRL